MGVELEKNVKGDSGPQGILTVRMSSKCQRLGIAPMIAPKTRYVSLYVLHDGILDAPRLEFAQFLADVHERMDYDVVLGRIRVIGKQMLALSFKYMGEGLPRFDMYVE